MQQGKHTDYEKQLHDDMIAGLTQTSRGGESPPSSQLTIDTERHRGTSPNFLLVTVNLISYPGQRNI